MSEESQDYVQILGRLAQEYQNRYSELLEALGDADPRQLTRQILHCGETTTDRFRMAQAGLLGRIASCSCEDRDGIMNAVITLSRCFDEMRILYQVMLDRLSETVEKNG